ncbi:hypothetical protein HD806DRAFT_384028 [Xylariaceae sp. AK1471]|nr:hypothetical protein HD806DRAFT_384028 [Xylariaceae sp. AK1471]
MSFSQNNSSNTLLMGFSVHQPAIGAPLQFFPAMGSKQLDDMINAYIPGDASILDKRAAVSMEFFEYTIATGDLFKFFMVYPTVPSAGASPAMDSGYCSGFSTSPVMSESQWTNTSSPQMASPSSSKKATSATDFSSLPGMKIMTKDGRDVTNSASRGCKTKEQRDHAHLMRIIKACEACRKKKTKCDPSHKRHAAGTSSGKVAKKTSKNSRPVAAPPQIAAKQVSAIPEFDQVLTESSPPLDSLFSQSLDAPTDGLSMEWDQFIQYDQEFVDAVPYDYDFIFDPAGYFSPAMTATASFSSSSTSPSQLPITPIDRDVNITEDAPDGHTQRPILPYLNPGGLEAGSNYVDFNLYSPESSFLDEELGFGKEVAASPIQSQRVDHYRNRHLDAHQQAANSVAASEVNTNAVDNETIFSSRRNVIPDIGDGLFHDTTNYRHQLSRSIVDTNVVVQGSIHAAPGGLAAPSHTVVNTIAIEPYVVDNVLEGVTSEGLYGREAIHDRRPSTTHGRLQSRSVPSSTAAATGGLREEQGVPEGSALCNSNIVETGVQTRSSSTLASVVPSSLLSSAEVSFSVRSSSLFTLRLELNVSQDNVHKTRSTALAQITMYRVPSSPTPSPSLVPVMTPGAPNGRSSTSDFVSRAILNTEKQMIRPPVSSMVRHSPAEQDSSPAVSWNAENALGKTAVVRQSFAAAGKVSPSGTLPTVSVIASLGALAVVALLSPIRTTMSKGNGLIENLQPIVSGKVARYTTAMLLFCLASFAPSALMFFVSMSALSVIAAYTQLCQHTPPHGANAHLPSATSYILSFAMQLHPDIINNAKASYTQIQRVVRCDLVRKLKSWTHDTSFTLGAKTSPQEQAGWLTSQGKMPLL